MNEGGEKDERSMKGVSSFRLFSLSRVDSCHHPLDKIKEKNIWIFKRALGWLLLRGERVRVKCDCDPSANENCPSQRRDTISWHGLWRQLVALTLHRHSFSWCPAGVNNQSTSERESIHRSIELLHWFSLCWSQSDLFGNQNCLYWSSAPSDETLGKKILCIQLQ